MIEIIVQVVAMKKESYLGAMGRILINKTLSFMLMLTQTHRLKSYLEFSRMTINHLKIYG